jgi:hypothetical protein
MESQSESNNSLVSVFSLISFLHDESKRGSNFSINSVGLAMTRGSKSVFAGLPLFLYESYFAELSKNSGLLCGFGFSTTLSIFTEGKFSWDKESRPFSCQSSAIGCNFGLSDCP